MSSLLPPHFLRVLIDYPFQWNGPCHEKSGGPSGEADNEKSRMRHTDVAQRRRLRGSVQPSWDSRPSRSQVYRNVAAFEAQVRSNLPPSPLLSPLLLARRVPFNPRSRIFPNGLINRTREGLPSAPIFPPLRLVLRP